MRKYLSIFMGISIIIFICIFIILIIRTSGYSDFEEVNYHSVGFTGEYSGDNGDWLPMNEILGKDIAYATVTYRGHFTENIDVYETIFLFIRNLCVTFKVNGETLYSFGQEGTYPSFSKGPGITIGEVKTTGITTEDEIEIVINNPYYSHSTSSYQLFFDQMQVGEHSAIYRFVLREIWFPILIGISIIIVGLMTIATGLIASRYHRNYRIRLLALAFFAFTGGVYTLVNSMYQYLPLIIGNPVLCNIIEILPTFLLSIAICIYFRCFIRDKKIKSISTLCCCIAICSLTLLLSYNCLAFMTYIYANILYLPYRK